MSNTKMPTIFIGHGSPENAFEQNEFTQAWKKIAASFPQPRAILVISAHWTDQTSEQAQTTSVTSNKNPVTIHDFYGFPDSYYNFTYPAPGSLELASEIISLVKTVDVASNEDWGLDHGTWSVLAQIYPRANIPTVQLSIDENLTREKMFAIGQELAELRDEGVLIIGSGNIVHNLRALTWSGTPHYWAVEFDEYIKTALINRDSASIISFEKHPSVKLALPTAEHFLPLLYVLGCSEKEKPSFFCEKIFAGSLSMRCITFGVN